MDTTLDAFTNPCPAKPLQKLYFPEILASLRELDQGDRFARYKLKHEPYEYAQNLFDLWFDSLVKDETKLLSWAELHYGGLEVAPPSPSAAELDTPSEPIARFCSRRSFHGLHVDYAEFLLFKAIQRAGGRLAAMTLGAGKLRDRLTPSQYDVIVARRRISCERFQDGHYYVIRENFLHDKRIQADLAAIARSPPQAGLAWPLTTHWAAATAGVSFTASQLRALERVRDTPLVLMTGLAGTGKTTVIMAVIRAFIAADQLTRLWVICPTNMAIENIRTRLLAIYDEDVVARVTIMTIHALAYRKPDTHPSDAFLIFEEASMYDNISGAIIAKNPGNRLRCKYLITGDVSQLPPVSRPSVFRLILNAFGPLVVRLVDNFRSGELIIRNSTRMLEAVGYEEMDAGRAALVRLETGPNYRVIAYDDAVSADWLRPLRELVGETAATAVTNASAFSDLARSTMFITYRNVDVLRINIAVRAIMLAMHSGEDVTGLLQMPEPDELSDESFNAIQRSLRAERKRLIESRDAPHNYRIYPVYRDGRVFGLWEWQIGDRCRSLYNDPQGRISNGSIGYVKGFDGGLIVVQRGAFELTLSPRDLWPAYCITIHNAQGQEWTNVIFCELSGEPLLRELAYVAMTRARRRQYIMRLLAGSSATLRPNEFWIAEG